MIPRHTSGEIGVLFIKTLSLSKYTQPNPLGIPSLIQTPLCYVKPSLFYLAIPKGQEVQSMEGHENYVFCVNFNNPQANLLVR